jgi:hypothetical protein
MGVFWLERGRGGVDRRNRELGRRCWNRYARSRSMLSSMAAVAIHGEAGVLVPRMICSRVFARKNRSEFLRG